MAKKQYIQSALWICLAVLSFTTYRAGAQMADKQVNKILPHSPEAEAMAKYTALPVTLYSGLPQISVPIFELKGKSLSVAVSLGYNYNGFKPAETASSAGLGWSVQGGGVITRMVKGRVDHDDISADYDDYADVEVLTRKQAQLKKINDGLLDGEPDLYVFNCNGLSGKFILMRGEAYIFPFQNTKIKKISGGFLITSVNGDKYYFTTTETTHHHSLVGEHSVPDHVSSWYITQIVSADLADTINYSYNSYTYHLPPSYSESYNTQYPSQGTTPTWQPHVVNGDRISDAKVLYSITCKQASVFFIADTAHRRDVLYGDTAFPLRDITVHPGSGDEGLYKKFSLQHAYYNGKLNLTGVHITGTGESGNVQKYAFEYDNQDTSSNVTWLINRSLDKWGYYNGADNSGTMLFSPEDFPGSLHQYGNRSVNFAYCKTNVLTKLSYPTGGYTVFDYEINSYLDPAPTDGPGVRVSKISIFDNLNTGTASLVKEYTYSNAAVFFKSGVDVVSTIVKAQCAPSSGGCTDPIPDDATQLTYQTGTYSPLSELINTPFYYRNVTEVNRSATGNGRTLYVYNSYGADDPDVYLAQKTDQAFKDTSYINLQQTTNDYDLKDKFTFMGIRAVLYKKSLAPFSCFVCAGMLPDDPTQNEDALNEIYTEDIVDTWTSSYKTLQQSTSISWDANGSNPVSDTTKYYYDNPDHPYPTRVLKKNSKGEQVTTWMKYPMDYTPSGTTARNHMDSIFEAARVTAKNDYASCYYTLSGILSGTGFQPYFSHHTPFDSVLALYHCEDDYKTASDSVYARRDTARSVYYSSINTAQTSSSVPWKQAAYWMLANNMLSPVIEKYTTIHKADGNDYILSATRNEYSLVNGVAALSSVSATEINKPLLYSTFLAGTDGYYKTKERMGYDSRMNLSFHQKAYDIVESYLWGYNDQYPVTAVSNATPLSITGYATTSVLDNPGSDGALRTELDKVRTAMASSPALVSTYTYAPLKGVTSTRDKSGKITYYEYDDFSRLSVVRDQDSNIVKKYCYTLSGQAYTCDGSPIYYNDEISGTYAKNDCPSGGIASGITYTVTAGRYLSLISTADANSKAVADTAANGQNYANAHAYCLYYNDEVSLDTVKTNCISGTPDTVTYTVPAMRYSSRISKAITDTLARRDLVANALSWANKVGSCKNSSCSEGCGGDDKKCINGVCETGVKIYLSSVHGEFLWICTYHYEFSDGSSSDAYEEASDSECHNPDI